MIELVRRLWGRQDEPPAEIEPSAASLAAIGAQYHRLRRVAGLGMLRFARFTAEGVNGLPREGPVVILTNHAAQLDALHVNHAARRPVIFLASAAVFKGDLRARFLQSMGMVPKRKFTPDARAIRSLKAWVDAGAAVGIFPEGERGWDGRPLPMVPGLGKLLRLLGAPVVTGRIHNGDLHWPRWAEVPRWGRVHLEFDPPRAISRRDDPAELEAWVRGRIHLPPERARRWPLRGRDLARGLSNLLFCCPACGAIEALRDDGDAVRCGACSATWTLDVACQMRATAGPATDTTVGDEAARLLARVRGGWTPAPAGRPGVLLESAPGRLIDQSGAAPVDLGEGRLVLRDDALIFDGPTPLTLTRAALRAVSLEERRRLWLMTADRILEPDLPGDSMVKWGWALQAWKARG